MDMNNWIALGAEPQNVVRDENGVPIEWVLLRAGDTRLCQEGRDITLRLSADDLRAITDYYDRKAELIPVDSEHYLYELANRHKVDETEALRLFPGGVAALGFGSLALSGETLRIRVQWTPAAYPFLKEKIYKYFSPVIRGIGHGPLRLTSVAMTNTPAINHLDALAARSEPNPMPPAGGKESMSKINHALSRLLGRDSVALEAETKEEEKDAIAAEIDAKASLIEQVKSLLGLPADATIEAIVAALKAETEKAAGADEKQAKLDELAASAEKQAHADLVARGRAERKIVDADMEYINSLDSVALAAWLDHAAPKFPAPSSATARRTEPAAVALTAEDRAACRRLGISEDKFLKAKQERI